MDNQFEIESLVDSYKRCRTANARIIVAQRASKELSKDDYLVFAELALNHLDRLLTQATDTLIRKEGF